jgi:hypothetical protein
MAGTTDEQVSIRIQYQDGRWADLTEKQFEAICKVSGIARLFPQIQILASNPDVSIVISLMK